MMYTKISIFLLISFLSTVSAQNVGIAKSPTLDTTVQANTNSDEVNIDSLVAAQVAIARAKKWENYIAPEKPKPVLLASEKIESVQKNDWRSIIPNTIGLSEEATMKVGIILFSAMFVFFVVGIRRLILKPKRSTKKLRSNIELMRNEKAVSKKKTKLKGVRENLLNSPVNFSTAEGSLTKRAKELKIAKGEIILAAKIKSFELSVCSNER